MENDPQLPHESVGAQTDLPSNVSNAEQELSNEQRLVELYQQSVDELIAYLRKVFGEGPPEPNDVAQQAFERLSRQEDLAGVRNLKAFLWRTARNLVLTERRNSETRSKYEYEVEQLYFVAKGNESTPERVLEIKQQLATINRTLREMPERRRQALIWNRIEGLNVAAVARRLGITRAGAAKHIARAALDIDIALKRDLEETQ
ncbi:MAG: sigma-70 family RNA polymerase sigma factor [Pseudomonadota bacterium]